MREKWSNLTKENQDEIIDRVIYKGEDVNDLAQEFNLKASSLSRTIRRVKTKKERQLVTSPKSDTITRTDLEDDKFSVSIIGDMTPGSNPEHRRLYLNTSVPLTGLIFTDTHFPYNDQRATDCFLRAVEKLPHDFILNGGDTLDCTGLSKYGIETKDEFSKHLGAEIAGYHAFAGQLRERTDKKVITLFGNHMRRFIYWQYKNPAVMYIDEMQIDSLMKMFDFGWYPNVGEALINGDMTNIDFPKPELMIHHGTLSRKGAGNTARGEADNRWTSSISGHIHRLGINYRKTLHNQIFMGEAGTLRTLHPTYMANTDWQHGFLYVTIVPGDTVYGMPLLIKDGITYYEGQKI